MHEQMIPQPVITPPYSYARLADLRLLNGEQPDDLDKGDWKTWVIESDFVYIHGEGMEQTQWAVPMGFKTDFASIPRMMRWRWTPSGGPWSLAAILHDYLYSSAPDVSQRQADLLFRDCAVDAGAGKLTARLMYRALQLGGRFAFRSNRRRYAENPTWRMFPKR